VRNIWAFLGRLALEIYEVTGSLHTSTIMFYTRYQRAFHVFQSWLHFIVAKVLIDLLQTSNFTDK